MKNKLYIAIYCLLLIMIYCWMASCTKVKEEIRKNNSMKSFLRELSGTDSATVYNYVWLNGDRTVAFSDSSYHITVGAAFTDSITNQIIAINGLSVNSRALTASTDHTYYFGYSDSTVTLGEGLSLYGTNVKIKITGTSSADTLTKIIYMPKKVFKTRNDFPLGSISNSTNLTINWTPDSLTSWRNVIIKIWYNATMSRFLSDSTLPAQDKELTYIVPDNGTYTISSADLQGFQKKSYVWISLGRGSQVDGVLPVSHKRVFYFATSSESSPPLYVQ